MGQASSSEECYNGTPHTTSAVPLNLFQETVVSQIGYLLPCQDSTKDKNLTPSRQTNFKRAKLKEHCGQESGVISLFLAPMKNSTNYYSAKKIRDLL